MNGLINSGAMIQGRLDGTIKKKRAERDALVASIPNFDKIPSRMQPLVMNVHRMVQTAPHDGLHLFKSAFMGIRDGHLFCEDNFRQLPTKVERQAMLRILCKRGFMPGEIHAMCTGSRWWAVEVTGHCPEGPNRIQLWPTLCHNRVTSQYLAKNLGR